MNISLSSFFFSDSSFLKINAINKPITIDIRIAATARARPMSYPSTCAVRTIARMFIAGPENRKAVAGPMPAPRLWILVNKGRMVQLQTARIVPERAATG